VGTKRGGVLGYPARTNKGGQVVRLLALMGTKGVRHGHKGAWTAKAGTFDNDQKYEVSRLVDELCLFFKDFACGDE